MTSKRIADALCVCCDSNNLEEVIYWMKTHGVPVPESWDTTTHFSEEFPQIGTILENDLGSVQLVQFIRKKTSPFQGSLAESLNKLYKANSLVQVLREYSNSYGKRKTDEAELTTTVQKIPRVQPGPKTISRVTSKGDTYASLSTTEAQEQMSSLFLPAFNNNSNNCFSNCCLWMLGNMPEVCKQVDAHSDDNNVLKILKTVFSTPSGTRTTVTQIIQMVLPSLPVGEQEDFSLFCGTLLSFLPVEMGNPIFNNAELCKSQCQVCDLVESKVMPGVPILTFSVTPGETGVDPLANLSEIADVVKMCNNCNRNTAHLKSTELSTYPKYLLVKLVNPKECHHLGLTAETRQIANGMNYQLDGFVTHIGDTTRGHYTYSKRVGTNWVWLDDCHHNPVWFTSLEQVLDSCSSSTGGMATPAIFVYKKNTEQEPSTVTNGWTGLVHAECGKAMSCAIPPAYVGIENHNSCGGLPAFCRIQELQKHMPCVIVPCLNTNSMATPSLFASKKNTEQEPSTVTNGWTGLVHAECGKAMSCAIPPAYADFLEHMSCLPLPAPCRIQELQQHMPCVIVPCLNTNSNVAMRLPSVDSNIGNQEDSNCTLQFGSYTFVKDKGAIACPICDKSAKNILQHLKKSQSCIEKMGSDYTPVVNAIIANRKEEQKLRKRLNMQEKRVNQSFKQSELQSVKNYQDKNKIAYRASHKDAVQRHQDKDKDAYRASHRDAFKKSRDKDKDAYRASNKDAVQRHQDKDKDAYRASHKDAVKKNRDKDMKLYKEKNKNVKQKTVLKKSINWSAVDRRKAFQESVIYGPIFVCSICQQCHYSHSVLHLDSTLETNLTNKHPTILEEALEHYVPVEVNNEEKYYICKTCCNYMRKGKVPPWSVKNGLQTVKLPMDLQPTELEANLVSRNLIFQKIFKMTKSRWLKNKDRIISIPIPSSVLQTTADSLPRIPSEAHLLPVKLKRKIEYKNHHHLAMIDPHKIIRLLKTFKDLGHPSYQFYDNSKNEAVHVEEYHQRCLDGNPHVDDLIMNIDMILVDEVIDEVPVPETVLCYSSPNSTVIRSLEDEIEYTGQPVDSPSVEGEKEPLDEHEKEEAYYMKNDAIRKYQFNYNNSTAFNNKYPELDFKDPESLACLNIAPGENQPPSNILMQKDWVINSFPHLFPNGKCGLHWDRLIKLTDQKFFVHLIRNMDQQFADNPAFLFAIVAYIESKQIERNISLCGLRGKLEIDATGNKSYNLKDPYMVLDKVSNTPKYWKSAKGEFIAKLENLGPFQFFFTLSCADLRWSENFSTVLRQLGFSINYEVRKDGTSSVLVSAPGRFKDKLLDDVLKEDVDESQHEVIRKHVVLATRNFNNRAKNFITHVIMGKNNPMMVKFYSYRVEFQNRGAAHIHGVLWTDIDKHEEQYPGITVAFQKFRHFQPLAPEEETAICKFADASVTCSTSPAQVGTEVSQIALKVNHHHHTRACRKYNGVCRFNYPRLPSCQTLLAKPLNMENSGEEKRLKKEYQNILQAVKTKLEEEGVIQTIMAGYNKSLETLEEYVRNRKARIQSLLVLAGFTPEHITLYENALAWSNKSGNTIVLARDIDETYINSFNPEWVSSWNGNTDLQLCLDYYAVITYITDYYSKDDTHTVEEIKRALQSVKTYTDKETMRLIKNVFLKTRETGQAEAVYKILPDFHLCQSNIKAIFLPTVPLSQQSKFLVKCDSEAPENPRAVRVKDHEGMFMESESIHMKYYKRPSVLENMCMAQFVKMYKTTSRKINREDEDNSSEEPDEEGTAIPDRVTSTNNFDYIMTKCLDSTLRTALPKMIELSPVEEGEPVKIMGKRSFPAALKIFKYNVNHDAHAFYISELILYYPHRSEADLALDDIDQCFELYQCSGINTVKAQVMPHMQGVEEARYHVEETLKNQSVEQNALEEVGILLDAQAEQENQDDLDEGMEESDVYVATNPDNLDLPKERDGASPTVSSLFPAIKIPCEADLLDKTRSLDADQLQVLNIAVDYAKRLVMHWSKATNPLPSAPMVICHGGAGAGKSTTIHILTFWTQKILQSGQQQFQRENSLENPFVVKLAFTGAAATLINGATIHSAFGLPLFVSAFRALSDKKLADLKDKFSNLRVVIIDEMSMVTSDMLYMLDARLQQIKGEKEKDFGGVALFLFGDLMQLRPIGGTYIFDEPKRSDFQLCYHSFSLWDHCTVVNLTHNHRQGEDKSYANLLNRARIGTMTDEDVAVLETRVRSRSDPEVQNITYIIPVKKGVREYNKKRMSTLMSTSYTLKAQHFCKTIKNFRPRGIDPKSGTICQTLFEDEILVKVGCHLMIIYNIDTADGLINGARGILQEVVLNIRGNVESLIIKFENPTAGKKSRLQNPALHYPEGTIIKRKVLEYAFGKSKKIEAESFNSATLVQFPVSLCFAVTAHKIQGQSIKKPERIAVDITSVFTSAMAYVMMSRVEELNQLFILDQLIPEKIRPCAQSQAEKDRLDSVAINETPIWPPAADCLIIAALNISSLPKHFHDLTRDKILNECQMVCLCETWLPLSAVTGPEWIPYRCIISNGGRGKGLATYAKNLDPFDTTFSNEVEGLSIMKHQLVNIDVISVYRSNSCTNDHLITQMKEILNPVRTTLVLGDFNHQPTQGHPFTRFMQQEDFKQLVEWPTQETAGNTLDHIYIRDPAGRVSYDLKKNSSYFSDHTTNLIRIQFQTSTPQLQ